MEQIFVQHQGQESVMGITYGCDCRNFVECDGSCTHPAPKGGRTAMNIPATERETLANVMRQAESDLAAAHAEICKLQGLDPATHSWPDWSSPANTLRWFADIRQQFGIEPK